MVLYQNQLPYYIGPNINQLLFRLGKINSVAVVEDKGGYSGVLVAVHELGHLLGVVHDGDHAPSYLPGPGAASCSWYDGYIMSDQRRDYRGHQWSSCSLQQLRQCCNLASKIFVL